MFVCLWAFLLLLIWLETELVIVALNCCFAWEEAGDVQYLLDYNKHQQQQQQQRNHHAISLSRGKEKQPKGIRLVLAHTYMHAYVYMYKCVYIYICTRIHPKLQRQQNENKKNANIRQAEL